MAEVVYFKSTDGKTSCKISYEVERSVYLFKIDFGLSAKQPITTYSLDYIKRLVFAHLRLCDVVICDITDTSTGFSINDIPLNFYEMALILQYVFASNASFQKNEVFMSLIRQRQPAQLLPQTPTK